MIALCGNIEIGYDDVGSGTPVVFLHGFPHNRSLWSPQVHALVDRARCIAPDLRGFGDTTAGGPYSMEQYADDVICLLDALRIERVVVVGISMGGYAAFALWRKHRTRVRALVLADTRAGVDTEDVRRRREDLIALAREKGSAAVADAMITGMIGKSTREKCPEIIETVYRMLASAPIDGVVGALEAMLARPDAMSALGSIDVPTLIVVGDEDVLTPVRESHAMHQGIRGSRLEVLSGAGHVSNFERPAAFNHVVSEFLASLTLA